MARTAPRRMSFDLKTNNPKKVIEVLVRYCADDPSGKNGYWASIVPVELEGIFRTTVAYSGVKVFLKSAKRFSQKELERLKDIAYDHIVENKYDDTSEFDWESMLYLALEKTELELV